MFNPQLRGLRSVLCLGCHPDDIEIGCGGTLLKLRRENPSLQVHWLVLSGEPERAAEARRSATSFLGETGGDQVVVEEFPDSYFPSEARKIKDSIQSLAARIAVDLVFTHRLEDRHQDHRLVAELTWQAFRNHLVFEYEIPKYEGDLGHPNVFVPLAKELCDTKIELTYDNFPSQRSKPWFRKETFSSLLRLRGLECNSPSGYAEAFHCRKMTL